MKKIIILLIVASILFAIPIFIINNRYSTRDKAKDSHREFDIREIGVAMELYIAEHDGYMEITDNDFDGRIDQSQSPYIHPNTIPTDPGGGKVKGCNDVESASYRGFDNTSSRGKFCIYACLQNGKFYAASHKGTKMLDNAPIDLDCWPKKEKFDRYFTDRNENEDYYINLSHKEIVQKCNKILNNDKTYFEKRRMELDRFELVTAEIMKGKGSERYDTIYCDFIYKE